MKYLHRLSRGHLFIALMFLALEVAAQTASVTGIVLEQVSQEPLRGAVISLYNSEDSMLVSGSVTDGSGRFTLNALEGVSCFLEVNFLGFTPHTIADLIIHNAVDIDTLYLRPSDILLSEVIVTGEQDLLSYHLDKKVYHVDKDLMAGSSTVTEILQNIPSISVDIDGEITLRNSENVTFFLNGRPSALLRRDPTAVLAQMPANSVDRIEIITNPSAKYRPDGTGGIINVVLKEETHKGFTGQLNANIGTEKRYNGNVSLNHATENLTLYGNYGIRHSEGTRLYTDDRSYKEPETELLNSRYHEDGRSTSDALSHQLFGGLDVDVNDYNSIELSGSYFSHHALHKGHADILSNDPSDNPEYILGERQSNDESEDEGEAGLTYEHAFKNHEDHTLTFETALATFKEEENLTFNQTYTFPGHVAEISHQLIRKKGNQTEINVDYTLPVGEEGEFESGYAGEFVFEKLFYDKDVVLSEFSLNQNIHALYCLYGQSLGDLSFKGGLRAEQTDIISHLTIPTGIKIPNHYFKMFPTLHLGYELNEDQQISLSYSKRINRPDPDELNPNPEFSDPRSAESGNPDLKPEQEHSIEFEYQSDLDKLTLSTVLYYRYQHDAFTQIESVIGDSIILSTIANLDTRQSTGLEAVLSGTVSSQWNFSLTGDVYYTTIDGTELGYSENKSAISGLIKGYSLVRFGKFTSLQLNAYYYFPSITPQGNRQAYFYLNGGFKQQLFKNRASITLSATDIFHTSRTRYIISSDELDQKSTYRRRIPVVYLGFIWRLNNYSEKEELQYEGEGMKG